MTVLTEGGGATGIWWEARDAAQQLTEHGTVPIPNVNGVEVQPRPPGVSICEA